MAGTAFHSQLTSTELHYSKIDVNTDPYSIAPTYVGQSVFDETNSILYIANGTSSVSNWQAIVGSGGPASVTDVGSTTYTILDSDNNFIKRMTNASARTITIIESPLNGFSFTIQDGANTANSANITLNTQGGNVFSPGGGTSYKIQGNSASYTFTYDSNVSQWFVKQNFFGGSIPSNISFADITDSTKQIAYSISGSTTATETTLTFVQTSNRAITFPDITDTLVAKTTTDILTNKSFNNAVNVLAANSIQFWNSGNTFYTAVKCGANSSNLTITWPITAPSAGQALISSDIVGSLAWYTIPFAVAPTIQKFTSGSGIYTTPTSPSPLYIRVRMVGGGGGGAGSGITSGGGTGGNGGNSIFGTSLLIANGGTGGTADDGTGGAGGTASLGVGPIGVAMTGATGGGACNSTGASSSIGGMGGSSLFGGAGNNGGTSGTVGQVGGDAIANTGSGGGGAGGSASALIYTGSGGGAGGFLDAIITSPLSSYAYVVGVAGTFGTAGTTGQAGGMGGSGFIIVEEYYS